MIHGARSLLRAGRVCIATTKTLALPFPRPPAVRAFAARISPASIARRPILNRQVAMSATPQGAAAATANGSAAANGAADGAPHPPIDGPDDSHWRPHALAADDDEADWVEDLDLEGARAFDPDGNARSDPPRYLVLYGSLRERSYSRLLAYEFARILEALGGRVRVFDPTDLPVQGSCAPEANAKVQELRNLAIWAQGYVWVSPEQHGTVTAVFKNQIDWIPLSLGSVRPTQGRTLAIAQVCGGSQSFNTVSVLRLLGRYMRCIVVPNQSSGKCVRTRRVFFFLPAGPRICGSVSFCTLIRLLSTKPSVPWY